MYADRVKDTTLSTGTGAITLVNSAPTGYQTFAAAFGATPQTVAYCIADQAGNNWEVGTGTFNGTTGLTRTTVLGSSNAGAAVAFTAGTKDVFCTAPAKYLDTFTSSNQGVVPASGGGTANFLRADGSFATPPATAPAGFTSQIQYNNAGAFGGASTFTYNSGTDTLSVGFLNSAIFTSSAVGLVPASGGSSAQYLSADGTFTTPTAAVTPAGADTQIQYNNAGVLGANANFTYSSALNTLSLGPATGTATFTTRAPTTAQNPSTFVIAAQNSIRTAGTSPGGPLTLRSGNGRPTGAGAGGALSITSGNAGTTGAGGAINITAGAGGTTSGDGGAINITGGSPTSGLGGDVTVQSGPAAFLYLNGGNNPNGNGGDVRGQAGQGSGAGVANGGNFLFTGGQANGTAGGNGGSLEFLGGGGAGAGGRGGFATFRNGLGGTVADLDGNIILYVATGSSIPGSIFLESTFGTPTVEVTRNASTSAAKIGFFNALPVEKPTVTGSRASGAALVSLLNQLAALGLITNSTTA
jgi:hypothetical protein